MTEKQKMISGEWFNPFDPELAQDREHANELMHRLNSLHSIHNQSYIDTLHELCPNCQGLIRQPLYCDYGYNIYTGKGSFINFDCALLDLAPIHIGERSLIGPKVQILTATHPLDAAERATGSECGREIHIGDDCWLGGGVIVCPGVRIGDRCIIGAGSVVTRDIPNDSIAAGNPAKILRKNDPK